MSWPPLLRALCVLAGVAVGAFESTTPAVAADDVVYVARGKNLQLTTKLTGQIVDYTGRELTLLVGGTPTSHKAEHVIRVETEFSAAQQAADRLFKEEKYREALAEYTAAGRDEQRRWVRRQIMAQMVWCHRHLDDIPAAGDTFLSLLASDPQTIHFDCIPLAWSPGEPHRRLADKCRHWLSDENSSPGGLIGASHLLSTADSPAATRRLERLAFDPNAHIALLAQAQLWRIQMVTNGEEQFAQWSQTVERMPQTLGGGPHFVLGLAWSRVGNHQQAALDFLRVPILHANDAALSARALLEAGRALQRAGQDRQSARLWAEVASQYPQSQVAGEARRLLQESATQANSQ